MHVLPELKKLEHQFPNELVVIGVHSAKFDAEKDTENIISAVLRHEIEHPVFNDGDHLFWNTLGVSSWPTIYLIDPEGKAVWGRSGEFKAEEVAEVLKLALPYYRSRNLMNERPFPIELEASKLAPTPLRFPGKLLADEPGNRLFISDSNHNRIVIATLDGKLLDIIGTGAVGRTDGDYKTAMFDHPQGMALHEETLYIADTENHLLRKVDLKAKQVTTIAGRGTQARHPWPGLDEFGLESELPTRFVGQPKMTAINSPWDLCIHDGDLYIAMAGPHQIWKMPLDESEIGPYAGNGREDIVDGPLLPRQPYAQGYSSFAQPSGLSSDGTWLYVADSEGSSIRAVPFDATQEVRTVVGTSELPFGRLFAFGDVDGPKENAKLQHALGVAFVEGKLYVADTYNNKIKTVDGETGHTTTLVGTGDPGSDDKIGTFDEPAGIAHAAGRLYVADTNNHLIRTIDLATKQVATLAVDGLTPPTVVKVEKKPSFKGAIQEKVTRASLKPAEGAVKLKVSLNLPSGWKINTLAPMSYWVDAAKGTGPVDRTKLGKRKLDKPFAEFDVSIPVAGEGEDEITISLNYYYCQEGDEGLCKMGSVVFTVPLKVAADGAETPAVLRHQVPQ
jgi:sugar lactone lactonase YvrE